MFLFISCITSAQSVSMSYYDEYLYMNTYYPVVYIDTYPHYFYNSTWVRITYNNYRLIRHLDYPCYYRGHDKHYFTHRPVIHEHRRPVISHPQNRYDNHQPQIHQRPGGNHPQPTVRPNTNNRPPVTTRGNVNTRPQQNTRTTPNRGMQPQGNRGGRR